MVTQRVAVATSHQVISPAIGMHPGPRYSIPFFQTIRQDIKLPEIVLKSRRELSYFYRARNFAF